MWLSSGMISQVAQKIRWVKIFKDNPIQIHRVKKWKLTRSRPLKIDGLKRCNVLLKWSHFRWHLLIFCVVLRRSTFHHAFSQALQDAWGLLWWNHSHPHLPWTHSRFLGLQGYQGDINEMFGGNLGWCFEASWCIQELFFFGHFSVGIIFSLTKALIYLVQHPRKRLGNIY